MSTFVTLTIQDARSEAIMEMVEGNFFRAIRSPALAGQCMVEMVPDLAPVTELFVSDIHTICRYLNLSQVAS